MSWADYDFLLDRFDDFMGEEEVIGRIRGYIRQAKEGGFESLKHFIFYGGVGTGKTLAANIFAKEILSEILHVGDDNLLDDNDDHFQLYNAGDYRKRDFDREIVPRIRQETEKIIVFDEADELDQKIQVSLRSLVLDYAHVAKFIIIYNNVDKVDKVLRESGRMWLIHFEVSNSGLRKIAEKVVKEKDVDITSKKLDELVIEAKGSPRRLIDLIQDYDAYPTDRNAKENSDITKLKDDLGL